MAILIDGYNLMHAAGIAMRSYGPGGLEKARRALLGLLASSLDEDEIGKTTIVFDAKESPAGSPRVERDKGLDVRFASDHEDADALLEELILADSAPRRLLVVSSDHRIQRAARRRRARGVDSEVFIEQLMVRRRQPKSAAPREPIAKRQGAGSEAETAYWLEEFKHLVDDPNVEALSPDRFDEE